MFWVFWAAHFAGDYPLQPDWMVEAKRTVRGLTMHVLIHFALLALFTLPHWSDVWPYLIFITIAHFLIDTFKNFLARRRPRWVVGPYIFDQFLHLGSLLLAADWLMTFTGLSAWDNDRIWPVYLIGYLVPTYVWFISERIIFVKDDAYNHEIENQMWPRMLARAGFVTLFLLGGRLLLAAALPAVTIAIHWPYQSAPFRRRMVLTDVGVALTGALLILLAGGL